jgi:hypothetical protein
MPTSHLGFENYSEFRLLLGFSCFPFAGIRRLYGKSALAKAPRVGKCATPNGGMGRAEFHWYEASGIGKKEFEVRRFVDYPARLLRKLALPTDISVHCD